MVKYRRSYTQPYAISFLDGVPSSLAVCGLWPSPRGRLRGRGPRPHPPTTAHHPSTRTQPLVKKKENTEVA